MHARLFTPSLLAKSTLFFATTGSILYFAKANYAFAKNSSDFALDPKNFKSFPLSEKKQLTRNTSLYRFALEEKDQQLGLHVASCLVVKAPIGENGKDVIRPYTPTSEVDSKGYFDLIVKTYPNGVMSKHLDSLKVGDTLDAKGPFPKYKYVAGEKKDIGMIAGGTGITPMYQVIREALKDSNDTTRFSLLYANVSERDIILQNELDHLVAKHPERFHVHYIVDKAISPKTWNGDTGFIDISHIAKYMPPPNPDNLIFVCGPPPMMKHVSGDKAKDFTQGPLSGLLKYLEYTENQVYKF